MNGIFFLVLTLLEFAKYNIEIWTLGILYYNAYVFQQYKLRFYVLNNVSIQL